MKCPKCGRKAYASTGDYQQSYSCAACKINWTAWQQAENKSLKAKAERLKWKCEINECWDTAWLEHQIKLQHEEIERLKGLLKKIVEYPALDCGPSNQFALGCNYALGKLAAIAKKGA